MFPNDQSFLSGVHAAHAAAEGTPPQVAGTDALDEDHFPGHFQPHEWLGDFISKIRAADAMSGLQHAKADLQELDEINAYSKNYHHQQNASADLETIQGRTYPARRRTQNLVGGLSPIQARNFCIARTCTGDVCVLSRFPFLSQKVSIVSRAGCVEGMFTASKL
jgi:hypothetical protein